VAAPQLFIDGLSASDVQQGGIGNCYFLSSLASLTCYPHLLDGLFVKSGETDDEVTANEALKLKHGIATVRLHRLLQCWIRV
jgi:hypothetical protein